MADDIQQKLFGAFPTGTVFARNPAVPGSRFDVEDRQNMEFLGDQLKYLEFESEQWALFQDYRQQHLEKDISREDLCRAYYRWVVDSLEPRNRPGGRSEPLEISPLRINQGLQRRLVAELKEKYPELRDENDPTPWPDLPRSRSPSPLLFTVQSPTEPTAQSTQPSDAPQNTAAVPQSPASPAAPPEPAVQSLQPPDEPQNTAANPAAPPSPVQGSAESAAQLPQPSDTPQHTAAVPQPPVSPAAPSPSDNAHTQSNVTGQHGANANPQSLPEEGAQQPTRPPKRKRDELTREMRSLRQLGGPGNVLVGLGVDNEPGEGDGENEGVWVRRLRPRTRGRVAPRNG